MGGRTNAVVQVCYGGDCMGDQAGVSAPSFLNKDRSACQIITRYVVVFLSSSVPPFSFFPEL